MAHPSYVIQQAIFQFFDQWTHGLQPSLEIKTEENGSIVVSTRVKVHHSSCHAYGRQSGRGARRRRRAARAQSHEHETETVAVDINKSADETETEHDFSVVTDNEVVPTFEEAYCTPKLNSSLTTQEIHQKS